MRLYTMVPDPFSEVQDDIKDFNGLVELFHENSKIGPLYPDELLQGSLAENPLAVTRDQLEMMHRAFKIYESAPQVKLPALKSLPPLTATFQSVIERRRTVRNFKPLDLDLNQLSYLLNLTYGITNGVLHDTSKSVQFFRACPSGGALYPLEFYIVPLRPSSHLADGLYHFNVRNNSLEVLQADSNMADRLKAVTMNNQPADLRHVMDEGSLAVVITGVFGRLLGKYGTRGYRYMMYEAGHAMQNLLLATQANGFQAFQSAAFDDDLLSDLLNIHGVEEAPLYYAVIGGLNLQAARGWAMSHKSRGLGKIHWRSNVPQEPGWLNNYVPVKVTNLIYKSNVPQEPKWLNNPFAGKGLGDVPQEPG